jgi:hypothetical protein
MFSTVYGLELHNEKCVALANLRLNICKNRIENRICFDLVMMIKSACLLVSAFGYIGPLGVFIVGCKVVINI